MTKSGSSSTFLVNSTENVRVILTGSAIAMLNNYVDKMVRACCPVTRYLFRLFTVMAAKRGWTTIKNLVEKD